MSQPYVGEIRMFAGSFAPSGWAFCDGALVPIAQYEALFNLIGTTYGGDGQNTFALPDLRGRVPVHHGTGGGLSSYALGQRGGVETVTLTTSQLPAHTHTMSASTAPANAGAFRSAVLASSPAAEFYGSGTPSVAMAPGAIGVAGQGLPHSNMAPVQAINFIISLFGVFPSQN